MSHRTLYIDASDASRSAESALQEAHLDFQAIFIEDPDRENKKPPQLLTSEGFFRTIDDICWYAKAYGTNSILL